MIIRTWDGEQVVHDDNSFIITDRRGNQWRFSDDNHDEWSFEIQFIGKANGGSGRVSVASVTGNVMDIGVAK